MGYVVFDMRAGNAEVAVWIDFLALFSIASDDGVVIASYLDESFRKDRITNANQACEATIIAGGFNRFEHRLCVCRNGRESD